MFRARPSTPRRRSSHGDSVQCRTSPSASAPRCWASGSGRCRDGACSRTPLWLSAGRRVTAAAGPASAVLLSVPVLRSVVFTCLLPSTMAQLSIVNGKNGDVMPCRTLCSARFCGRGEWVSVVATSNEESPMKASVTQHPQLDTGGTPKLGL